MSDKVLIVDDDPAQRRLLEAAVQRMGFSVLVASDGKHALDVAGQVHPQSLKAIETPSVGLLGSHHDNFIAAFHLYSGGAIDS